ncbi:MAG: 4'-phosphopantetheinyl transferase superfamily protein [Tannerella sp.]|jgi:phosphopantetheinyl transferase|nr:4'-phosphopantetheinyl transferase superfamily protein [Tannerella sp.]
MPVLQKSVFPLWGIWKIEESWEELLALSECPDAYLPFLNGSRSDSRKAEWLAVRMLLKELTGSETRIAYRAGGAPCLPDAPFHISISHTRGYAAVLLHPDHPAGIDIEYRSERIQKLKSRFLSEPELRLLGEHPGSTELLICWSAKETAFKMTGQHFADWQKDLHILACDFSRTHGLLTVKETLTPRSATCQIHYNIAPDFVLTRFP